MSRPTFVIMVDGIPSKHYVGDRDCTEDWCNARSYPAPCEEPGCSGLVHACFGDENSEGEYYLVTRCDVCGEPE